MNKASIIVFSVCFAVMLPACSDTDNAIGMSIVRAARAQIGKTVRYDPAYRSIAYPNGDVPSDRGVCTDVVIRALRAGLGLDLQQLVHEDMKRYFDRYPHRWGLRSPDKNIDHRRVANLQTYFERKGYSIAVAKEADDYRPGDLVTCSVPPSLPHIMIVSDQRTIWGVPLVIHNIGTGAIEEDRLFEFELTGHYRIDRIAQAHAADTAEPRRR